MVVIDAMKSLSLLFFRIFEPSNIKKEHKIRCINIFNNAHLYLKPLHPASLALVLYEEVEA